MNAKIARNKSLLKEYDINGQRTVYLKDGDEFQIQLFNPETTEIAARITIEDTTLPHDIILMPGERVWLERFTDKQVKFKYHTYTVESNNKEVDKAISHNGNIKIEFYKKKKPTYWSSATTISTTPSIYYTSLTTGDADWSVKEYSCSDASCSSINSITTACASGYDTASTSTSYSLDNCDYDLSLEEKPAGRSFSNKPKSLSLNKTKETGRVGEGSYSNQKFKNVDMEFEYWPYTTEFIKVLPESQKPYTSEDLQRIYCTNCGRKLKTKYKYCPYCGNKIE